MPKSAADFHPEVLKWYDRYAHGEVDRRGFLNGVARYAIGGVTAAMLLESLTPRFAQAQQVAPADPRVRAKFVEIPNDRRELVSSAAAHTGDVPPFTHDALPAPDE